MSANVEIGRLTKGAVVHKIEAVPSYGVILPYFVTSNGSALFVARQVVWAVERGWAYEGPGEPTDVEECRRGLIQAYREVFADDEDRCEHAMFFSGAGACPQCGGGAEP